MADKLLSPSGHLVKRLPVLYNKTDKDNILSPFAECSDQGGIWEKILDAARKFCGAEAERLRLESLEPGSLIDCDDVYGAIPIKKSELNSRLDGISKSAWELAEKIEHLPLSIKDHIYKGNNRLHMIMDHFEGDQLRPKIESYPELGFPDKVRLDDDFHSLLIRLAAAAEAGTRLVRHQKGVKTEPLRRFVFDLAEIWMIHKGEKPTRVVNREDGSEEGPFSLFIENTILPIAEMPFGDVPSFSYLNDTSFERHIKNAVNRFK